ncbi:RNase H family protein [Devosia sp. MC521]|uniref:RNase H family protein n=1 Tax=Devosia sp. MC521 TaxID=2759954 RepID=UPI0015F9965C|nr:RNase H family protein [Devosia sp. MC521]MBJ6987081.1 hypothetical protein [Devosia sp. MC521]QMW62703.1 hypothetical protein H4N61_17735 [Devosia sp. MC521]
MKTKEHFKTGVLLVAGGARLGASGLGGVSLIKQQLEEDRVVRRRVFFKRHQAVSSQIEAEMLAAVAALKHAVQDGVETMVFRTSSQHVVKGMTEWMSGWEQNGWRNNKGKEVLHRDLWLILREIAGGLVINWEWASAKSDPLVASANAVADDAARGIFKAASDLKKYHPQLFAD